MSYHPAASLRPKPGSVVSSFLIAALAGVTLLSAPGVARGADEALKPWSSNVDPSDVSQSRVEEITAGSHHYTIIQGGTMDGRNCRSPMGCGISREGALFQAWESNRSLRMENIGGEDVINPWISNGRNNFRNTTEIVAAAVTPGMSDAEKAFALWFQEIRYRHHSPGDNDELLDPVKIFNVYGYNTCGNDSICLATLWRAAGLRAAPARALGHCISQAFYDHGWHFFDGDMHSVYLLRDSETVAGEQDLVLDHDLIKRDHSKGILLPDTWWDGQGMCAMYSHEGAVTGQRGADSAATMNMVLRPGEAIVWRWGQLEPFKHHGALMSMPAYPALIYNGLWEYRPALTNEFWRHGAAAIENIACDLDGLTSESGKKGVVVWNLRSPYVFVGGRISAEGDNVKFSVSVDGKTWQTVKDDLDKAFPTVGPARYEYRLKCELEGPARLRRLSIVNDIQMAPLAMPEMAVGENHFAYTDQSGGSRKMRITHQWVERSTARPPSAPQTALYPPDQGEANGTDIVFQWTPPNTSGAAAVTDFHFELSRRPDMRWPLSMGFYKLISRTADLIHQKDPSNGKEQVIARARYTLPQPGLLAPDRTYYWRVRAMNDKGVWGDWSPTWSFTPRAPSYPLDVALDYTPGQDGVLRWKPNPAGRRPAKYRIYGSDEKGFTIADQNFQGTVGVTKEEMAAWNPWFPANFIAETTDTQLAVLGPGVRLPAANKSYYRVVAADDQGKRSGPSDYAAAPRPVIYSQPEVTAKVGSVYKCPVRVNRSLGDLTARMRGGEQVSGYFDIEKPVFTIMQGPSWLKIDPTSGVLAGVPDVAGNVEVSVKAALEKEVRVLDEKALVWGNEKVLSSSLEQTAATTQNFVIRVQ